MIFLYIYMDDWRAAAWIPGWVASGNVLCTKNCSWMFWNIFFFNFFVRTLHSCVWSYSCCTRTRGCVWGQGETSTRSPPIASSQASTGNCWRKRASNRRTIPTWYAHYRMFNPLDPNDQNQCAPHFPRLLFTMLLVLSFAFHDLKFCLSSQLKAASCARCSSEMPPSKQVNRHSFTTSLIVWGSSQSQSGEAM